MRQELLDNSPRLAPEVLQKLLSEAYNPLSKQLSTLREEDCEGLFAALSSQYDLTNIERDVKYKLFAMFITLDKAYFFSQNLQYFSLICT